MRGPSGGDGRDAADGARLALAEADGEAGGRPIEAVYLDDTEAAPSGARPTAVEAAANARAATEDSTAIAYLGELDSGATRASLPITNEALMLQVSPGAAAVDLVAPFPGTDELPDTQPSDERSFGRVIPSDVVQAEAAASWLVELGVRQVEVLLDGSDFGRSYARWFRDAAADAGIETRQSPLPGGFREPGARLSALGRARIIRMVGELFEPPARPPPTDALVYAGYPVIRVDELALFAEAFGAERALASDAVLEPRFVGLAPAASLAPRTGADVELLVSSAALDPSQLPSAGEELAQRFRAEHRRPPGRYAAYGYEAMALILDSIDRASDPGDRQAVVEAFFDTADRESVLGTYSIDEIGETTLATVTGYRLEGGLPRPVDRLAGP